jgi:hypothetical protein
MADENTQPTQNTVTTPVTPVAQAPVVAEPTPVVATPVVEPVAQAPVVAEPTPVVATPVEPVAAPVAVAPAAPQAAPAPAAQGGLAGLGLGSFKVAMDSAKTAVSTVKDASGQGQAGFSKLTGTLSSVGGNVMGAVTGACTCPSINVEVWDKKKVILHKTFYKTFSTRAFGYHLTDAIDKNRGFIEMKVKDYKPVENPMVLDTNNLFWSTLFIEVQSADSKDPKVVTFDKELYCRVSKSTARKDLQLEVAALEQEMGKKPTEVYFWFVTCPKCEAGKEVRTVIMAA